MGYRPIRTVGQASEHGLFVEVVCRHCARRSLFHPSSFAMKHQAMEIARLAARMICTGGLDSASGCGARGAEIRLVTWPAALPRPDPPKPLGHPAPKGVDQDAWNKADERERKRLIRIARG